ncbi:Transposon Tf2-9 polyprotein [Labeo rohita]|uniref:Transposon Tf2-9 polyprotein n=1 Tax=Labeo rohita TaxID=84645 RepID=A0ABQ8L9M5_LABRO|nr:Transposon Tf2-9 polyprotein [Labeo rohita]
MTTHSASVRWRQLVAGMRLHFSAPIVKVSVLTSIFSTAPVLHHPDPERPFTVEVDASTTGVGAVLSQAASELSLLHPCAYFSRKLSPAEQNDDVGNRELLAIRRNAPSYGIWTGRSNKPSSRSQLHRNAQRGEFTYPAPNVNPFWAQLTTLRALDTQAAVGPSRSYNLVTGGTVCTIRYVQSCSVCAKSNCPCQLPTGKLVPLPIPQRPWSHLGVDFITDLPSSEGNTCVLVIVDRFSKSCKLVPLKGLPTAMEMAEQLFHEVFRHFGLPEEIVSDRGPQFISHVWKAFFKLLGISVNLSSGYHPQTNGQTERKIQELGRYLRAYCQDDQHRWSRFFPWAEYAQNSLRQDSTGLTPFQCILGYQPPLYPWTEDSSNVPAVGHWFRERERVWGSAHHHLQRAVCRQKIFADARRRATPIYQPGDLVWLSTRDLRLRLPCCKLSPRYIGPFQILRQINEVTFQLQLPPRYRIHPTFHVSLLKPFCPSATDPSGAEAEPPPPEVLDQPSIFTVREILGGGRPGGEILGASR